MQKHIQQFIDYLRYERQLSTHTCDNYQRDIQRASTFFFSERVTEWEQVDELLIRSYIVFRRNQNISTRSTAREISALRSFYSFLKRQDVITHNPLKNITSPKSPKRLPQTLSVEKMSQLLPVQSTQLEEIDIRDLAMFELMYSSGLRLSELVYINLMDLNLAEGLLRVTGKGNRQRDLPVGKMALKVIQKWLGLRPRWVQDSSEQAMFVSKRGKRISMRSVQYRLNLWANRLGIGLDIHPHMLRHAFASHILQSSGDLRAVQELLGHQNLATTQIYTQVDFQYLAKVYDKAHPRARKQN